jgi:SAM-dependent methyltransferase
LVRNIARQRLTLAEAVLRERLARNTRVGSRPSTATQRPSACATSAPLLPGLELVGLAQLDDVLARADEIERCQTFTERVRFLERYRLDYNPGLLPEDPNSDEYRAAQLVLYRRIAGVSTYDPRVNEVMSVDLEGRLRQPAPFDAGSTAAAGDHLIAYGFVCRVLDLGPGDRVLEYGAGQGNITLLLAMMGLDVTAIDISPEYVELIRRRASRDGVRLEAIVGQFGDAPPDGKPVDAILFYEAFHHASDHVGLVRSLRALLAPGGRVLFAGEPILDTDDRPWAGPWGVRIDGISLSAIRQHQCLELGFDASYFARMLMRNGFLVSFHRCAETAIGNTWVARVNDGMVAPNHITLPPDEERTWGARPADPGETYRYAGPMSFLTLDEDPRWRRVELTLTNHRETQCRATLATGSRRTEVVLAPAETSVVQLPLPDGRRTLTIETTASTATGPGATDDVPGGLAVALVKLVDR